MNLSAKKIPAPPRPARRRENEHHLQVQCVGWFDWQYPHLSLLLFAIPNGGHRGKAVAGKIKAEGVRAGVADLFLSVPSIDPDDIDPQSMGLYLEAKTPDGKLSAAQKRFRETVTGYGYGYAVFRTLPEFQMLVNEHLHPKKAK